MIISKHSILQSLKSLFILTMIFWFENSSTSYAEEIIKRDLNINEWNSNGFTDVVIRDVQIPKSFKHTSEYTHTFRYSSVVLRGSGWTYDEVVKRAVRVEEIYSQCNVWVEGVQIILTDQSHESRVFSHKEKTDLNFTKNIPIKSRPIMVYFKDDKDRNIAYAVPRLNRKSQHPYINTIWMSRAIKTRAYQKLLPNTYSDEAHELGHLLLNTTKHVFSDQENFMHEVDKLATDRINPDQCEIIRNSPLVSKVDAEQNSKSINLKVERDLNTSEWESAGFTGTVIGNVQIPKSFKHTDNYTHKFE